MWHQLKLVLWKNLKVRQRHWCLTIIQILIAIALFTFMAYARGEIDGLSKIIVNETTVYEPDVDWHHFHVENGGSMRLLYTPMDNVTENLIENIKSQLGMAGQFVEGFKTEADLYSYYSHWSNLTIWAIIFDVSDPNRLKYKIRHHKEGLWWNTADLYSHLASPHSTMYTSNSFLALQHVIDKSFIELTTGRSFDSNFTIQLQQFPYPPHKEDSGLQEIYLTYLPILTLISFIFICPAVLKRVAEEKASGIRELLKMNGMKPVIMWLGWYVHALTADLISIGIIVLLLKVPVFGAQYPAVEYCNALILFLFLFLYVIAAIASCFLIAGLFNNPSIAMVIGVLFWILSYVIPESISTTHPNMKWLHKMLFGLFPNVALKHGYTAISLYESRDVGVNWSNLHQSGSNSADDVTMLNVLLLLLFDTFLYLILTIYVDNVNPGQYGVPKPLHYPYLSLKRKFLGIKCGGTPVKSEEVIVLNPSEHVRCIQVSNLCKKFGHVSAVEGLFFDIRPNQIAVLLGHNGAGKTTTMSIITGMTPPTSGSVRVNGIDIAQDLSAVQQQMGLCPQHNLVFPDLTVREHLVFFATLKGATFADAGRKSDRLLLKLDMCTKKDSMAATLSGGMKRKLCLAMAMVGNSKVLILDEPTSGMDPESRRKFWDLLKSDRKERTILITTHFMDEAEALADQIIIMSHGKLLTQGTPMKLKSDYKTGYHFTVYLQSTGAGEREVVELMRASGLTEFEELYRVDNAVSFKLPLQQQDKFSKLFSQLEEAKSRSIIVDYNLKLNTLTDVFLKSKAVEDAKNLTTSTNDHNQQLNDQAIGAPRFKNAIASLLLKRLYFFKNKYHLYIPSFFIMLAVMILVIILGQPGDSSLDQSTHPLNLDLSIYGRTGVIFGEGGNDEAISKLKRIYRRFVENRQSDPMESDDVIMAISDKGVDNIAYYKQHMVVGARFNRLDGGKIQVTALFSLNALHSAPIALNLVTNSILELLSGDDHSISASNFPLPTIEGDDSRAEQNAVGVILLWFFLVPIGALLLVANFIIFPNAERVTNFIQVQFVCGINPIVYWLTNIFVDFALCVWMFAAIAVVLTAVSSFYDPNVYDRTEIATILVILLAYCMGAVPFCYLFSHKKTLTAAISLFLIVGLFSGVIPTIVIVVLEMSGIDRYMSIGRFLHHLFMCTCPQFAVTYTSVKFARKYIANKNWMVMDDESRRVSCIRSYNPCCAGDQVSECENYRAYFSRDGANLTSDIVEMSLVSGMFYFVVLCFFDSLYVKILRNKLEKFVVALIKRMRNDKTIGANAASCCEEGGGVVGCKTDSLRAKNLRKSYGFTSVVNGVTFNLTRGQCFGLLGVNGAGKSTTFKMLTRDEVCDNGTIKLLSDDGDAEPQAKREIEISNDEYLKRIGYCPQQNALNFALTGRQLLEIIGIMRGYSRDNAKTATNFYLSKFHLLEYADRPCLTYSGGNKRKLSTALAFIGRPSVILLDEPTSGVDPESTQQFWNTMTNEKDKKNVSFVLCSHSMEECETLCDRIGIMKEGRLECCGTLNELRNKYQNGFIIELKLRELDQVDGTICSSYESSLEADMKRAFDADPKDKHTGTMVYQITVNDLTLAKVFSKMEEMKTNYSNFLEDYTVSQTSLEDVFLKVAGTT